MGEAERAMVALRKLALVGNDRGLEADLLLARGDHAGAARAFREGGALSQSLRLLYGEATALIDAGRPAEALALAKAEILTTPDNGFLWECGRGRSPCLVCVWPSIARWASCMPFRAITLRLPSSFPSPRQQRMATSLNTRLWTRG
jgi:hypothetical protein